MRLASPCRVHALRLADVAHENRPTTRESSRGRKRVWPIVDVAQAKRGLVWRKTNSTSASKWQCARVLERPASQSGETQAAGKFRSSFQIFRLSSIAPLGEFDRTVVVAMIPVRMMQVTVDKIINVIAMWHRFVTAPGAMDVSRIVAAAVVARRALVRISRADLEPMLVYVIAMRMVQMPIMQIIDVIAVPDTGMAAVCAMLVVVVGMMRFVASGHRNAPRFTGYC
jgi:hypothetical protein